MSNKENNPVKNAIKAYLDKRAQEDTLFAASYAKENKSIDECFDYIIGEVRKKGNAVYMSDDEVFGMAVHYYDEDDIKVSPTPTGALRTATGYKEQTGKLTPGCTITDQDLESIKAQAIKEYKQQLKEAKEEKAKKREEAKHTAHAKELNIFTPSLFGEDEL